LYKQAAIFICWPTVEKTERSIEKIRQKYDFPGILGATDETHIKIIALRNDSDSYINRKGFHSIQLQIENLIILHFNVDVVFFFFFVL